ncbi:unnamed protein product [Allacma fusca]|uniref:DUF4789 domain-containing protein n=1 Tax=Allacma fusca TaxID=39272 RepID=A0A8J2KKB2_9HEXA|nr:unnamed protein product [Allacma fusca]
MGKRWQYIAAVIIAILVWAGFLWALLGHKMKMKNLQCNNTADRDSHPLIYSRKTRQCFPLHTQGPCKDGDWLTIQELSVRCSPNICLDKFDRDIKPEEQIVVPINSTCYKLGERCGRRSVVSYGETGYPNCTIVTPNVSGVLPGSGGVCPMGTFLFDGECVTPEDVDFD